MSSSKPVYAFSSSSSSSPSSALQLSGPGAYFGLMNTVETVQIRYAHPAFEYIAKYLSAKFEEVSYRLFQLNTLNLFVEAYQMVSRRLTEIRHDAIQWSIHHPGHASHPQIKLETFYFLCITYIHLESVTFPSNTEHLQAKAYFRKMTIHCLAIFAQAHVDLSKENLQPLIQIGLHFNTLSPTVLAQQIKTFCVGLPFPNFVTFIDAQNQPLDLIRTMSNQELPLHIPARSNLRCYVVACGRSNARLPALALIDANVKFEPRPTPPSQQAEPDVVVIDMPNISAVKPQSLLPKSLPVMIYQDSYRPPEKSTLNPRVQPQPTNQKQPTMVFHGGHVLLQPPAPKPPSQPTLNNKPLVLRPGLVVNLTPLTIQNQPILAMQPLPTRPPLLPDPPLVQARSPPRKAPIAPLESSAQSIQPPAPPIQPPITPVEATQLTSNQELVVGQGSQQRHQRKMIYSVSTTFNTDGSKTVVKKKTFFSNATSETEEDEDDEEEKKDVTESRLESKPKRRRLVIDDQDEDKE